MNSPAIDAMPIAVQGWGDRLIREFVHFIYTLPSLSKEDRGRVENKASEMLDALGHAIPDTGARVKQVHNGHRKERAQ